VQHPPSTSFLFAPSHGQTVVVVVVVVVLLLL